MIHKPHSGDIAEFYQKYIDLVPQTNDLLDELYQQHLDTVDLVTSLDDETLQFAYAPGKWTIQDILMHLMDCERIFCFRALAIARNDQTPLPGFDENSYAKNTNANSRRILDIVREFSVLRSSTIELFRSFDATQLARIGNANGKAVKASALAWVICGHEIHHRNIIEERYIGK
jgi:uncharacterized damage-inducible protein DinB